MTIAMSVVRLVAVVPLLLSSIRPTLSANLTLVVADPGKRFGSITIGDADPRGWAIHCHVVPPYHYLSRAMDLWIYPDQGLYATNDFSPGQISSIERTTGPTLQTLLTDVDAVLFPYFCKDFAGGPVTADTPLRIPENILFATTLGAHIGSPVEEIFASYGTPQTSHAYKNTGQLFLYYCGIRFTILHGVVDDIDVEKCK